MDNEKDSRDSNSNPNSIVASKSNGNNLNINNMKNSEYSSAIKVDSGNNGGSNKISNN